MTEKSGKDIVKIGDYEVFLGKLDGPLGVSLKKRLVKKDFSFFAALDSIDRFIDCCPIQTKETESSFIVATRSLIARYVMDASNSMANAMSLCESPIEGVMFSSFVLLSAEREYCLRIQRPGSLLKFSYESFPQITITPQYQKGDFRIDFLLEYEDIIPDFENQVKTNDGHEIPRCKNVKKNLLIECDGHDFHEKTKEQARKDKQRDRILQSLGYKIFRFTGSEIWSDPIKCAEEVFNELENASDF